MSATVDWDIAVRRAGALAPPGPKGSRAELKALVTVLHDAARRAPEYVGEITGMTEAARAAARIPVYVVDRARWAQANVEIFSRLTDGLLPEPQGRGTARIAGEEMGVVLSLLSTKVLGQFDPYSGEAGTPGRLVLVAPNVLSIERELDLDAMDFRLWVCLHEQTHAMQFAAAPWLTEHITGRMRGLVTTLSKSEDGVTRVVRAIRSVGDVLGSMRGGTSAPGSFEVGGALVEAFLDDEERAAMAEVVAVMSLLEGHADVVMDEVGPARLPSVRRIRAAFEKRRDGSSALDVMLRRLLGLDAKVAQYRNGARFVRDVVGRVGHDGLNAVWHSAEQLPSAAEIADPAAWVRRVHG